MLKAVIQQTIVHPESLQNPPAETIAIRPYGHHDTRAPFRNQVWFIPSLRRTGQYLHSVRNKEVFVPACPAISSAQHSNPLSGRRQPLSQRNDHRRFAGTTRRKIPDAYHTTGQPPACQPSGLIERRPEANDRSIDHRQWK